MKECLPFAFKIAPSCLLGLKSLFFHLIVEMGPNPFSGVPEMNQIEKILCLTVELSLMLFQQKFILKMEMARMLIC